MKKLTLLFAALFCLLTVSAEKLYVQPNSNWKENGARYAACFLQENKDQNQLWQDMTQVPGAHIYEVTIPADDAYKYVVFCRMNPATTENNWGNKWGQSADLDIPAAPITESLYVITEETENWGAGNWTAYTLPQLYTFTVKFLKPLEWEYCAIYAWYEGVGDITPSWPGTPLTADENGWYEYKFTDVADNVQFIINNNNGGKQTVNISNVKEDICYQLFAITEEGDNKGRYDVTAIDCSVKRVSNITFSGEELNIRPNQTYALSVTITPNDATNQVLTWTSSDETKVKVNAETGLIETLALTDTDAPVTITATATDGSNVQATCAVTVSEEETALDGLTIRFTKPEDNNWANVYFYAWNDAVGDETPKQEYFGGWPGKQITTIDADGKYYYTLYGTESTKIIFHTGDGTQTGDTEATADACFKATSEENEGAQSWVAKEVDCETGGDLFTPIVSIEWEYQATTMQVSEEYVNRVGINPVSATNQACQWTSSDETVATVKGGLHSTSNKPIGTIKALKAGKTTISVVFEDETNGKQELSYELTVLDKVLFNVNGDGGVLATVPATNAELWESFKVDYNAYYDANPTEWISEGLHTADPKVHTWSHRDVTTTMDKADTFADCQVKSFLTKDPNWSWLGTYLLAVTKAQCPDPAPTGTAFQFQLTTEIHWRKAMAAFFNCKAGSTTGNYSGYADFTVAGQLEAWKNYYQFGTAPTREGYAFTGWYAEPTCENKIDALSADFMGILYAGWTDHIALESVAWEVAPNTEMYAGTGADLAITLTPANTTEATCTWESSNPDAIAVAEGTVVNGKATTTIIAKAAAENVKITATFANGKTLEATITVKEKYTFELNDGTLPTVPANNVALWELFKPAYKAFYKDEEKVTGIGDDQLKMTIDKCAGFTSIVNKAQGFLTEDVAWKWLGAYIKAVAEAQQYTLATESDWRWHAQAFFNCSPANSLAIKAAGFTLAGLPVAWHPAYILAQIPTKENNEFTGWYIDQECATTPLTALPEDAATIYAGWKAVGSGTALENTEVTAQEVRKVVENGQVVIIRDGVRYNVLGTVIK